MAVTLTINGTIRPEARRGASLFDYAEAVGIAVPPPAASRANARSAWWKWPKAWSCLSAPHRVRAASEAAIFVCPARPTSRADAAGSAATPCAAATCASSGTRWDFRAAAGPWSSTRRSPARRPHPDRRRGGGPLHRADSRHRHGPGHHHRRAAADRSGNRRADCRHVVRESAALRRLRGHVAHRLRHAAIPASC